MPRAARQRPGPAPLSLLLPLLLACCADSGRGAPVLPYGLHPEQELQLWNKIQDACSPFLSVDSQPQVERSWSEHLDCPDQYHHLLHRDEGSADIRGISRRSWLFQNREAPDTLRELCLMLMGIPPGPQEQDEKDNTKRFLFHYSKTQKLGNSNVVASVLHPLLQLLPHLHERRMKRFPVDEEFQSPFGSRSGGYFLFRPRNGRRSIGLI